MTRQVVSVGPAGPTGPTGLTGAGVMATSFPGIIDLAESTRFYAPQTATAVRVTVSLITSGTSNTVVTIKRNGVSLGTLTLASAATRQTATFTSAFAVDVDYLTAEITTVGAGGPAGCTIQMRLTT